MKPFLPRAPSAKCVLALLWLGCACTPTECTDDSCAVDTWPTGSVPNDVAVTTCEGETTALVVASFDATLDAINLTTGEVRSTWLPPGSNPFAVEATGDGRAWVTLFETGEVAWLNACAGTILDVTGPPVSSDGLPPKTPQGIAAIENEAWVIYSNMLQASVSAAAPPVFGDSVLVHFRSEGDRLVVVDDFALGCTNAQGLAVDGSSLWIACSGAIGPNDSGVQTALSDGVLVQFDTRTGVETRRIDVERFAPATPAIIADRLVVGSLLRPEVRSLALEAASFHDATVVALPGADVDSIFSVTPLSSGCVLAAVFSTDTLHVLDPVTLADCQAPIALRSNDDGAATRGLLSVALVDTTAGVALLSLSAELRRFEVKP